MVLLFCSFLTRYYVASSWVDILTLWIVESLVIRFLSKNFKELFFDQNTVIQATVKFSLFSLLISILFKNSYVTIDAGWILLGW